MKGNNGISELWATTNAITAILKEWLIANGRSTKFLKFKPEDQIRLLKLKVWSTRYQVSIPDILKMIVPILRAQIHRKLRNPNGLGMKVSLLTGSAAKRILEEEIRKYYPLRENEMAWKEREQTHQLEAEQKDELDGLEPRDKTVRYILEATSVSHYVHEYQDAMIKKRDSYRYLCSQKWRRRRAYRGSPWI
jgi:hypothetical protein